VTMNVNSGIFHYSCTLQTSGWVESQSAFK